MKVLIITNLFPNKAEPARGIFNKQLIIELAKLCEVKVIAPLPWYRNFKLKLPEKECICGIEVYHPQYFMIPKVGRALYGFYFFASLIGLVRRIYKNYPFDIIFSPWVYPDGVGSYMISQKLKKPIVIQAMGSDINLATRYFLRKKLISWALRNSSGVIAKTRDLKERVKNMGVPCGHISLVPNGVDAELFLTSDKKRCRQRLGLNLQQKIILFVGNLEPVKGIERLLDAFTMVSSARKDVSLIVIGDGSLKKRLQKKSQGMPFDGRIKFMGRKKHEEIPFWLSACDILCLPSLNEGCPNVILESLACARPVVATKTGGIPELINSESLGILVEPGNVRSLANGLLKGLDRNWSEDLLRNRVSNFSWKQSASLVFNTLQAALKEKA